MCCMRPHFTLQFHDPGCNPADGLITSDAPLALRPTTLRACAAEDALARMEQPYTAVLGS